MKDPKMPRIENGALSIQRILQHHHMSSERAEEIMGKHMSGIRRNLPGSQRTSRCLSHVGDVDG